MVLIDKVSPPLTDVAILVSHPLRVNAMLFGAAQHDVRENEGGTTIWTIKGKYNT